MTYYHGIKFPPRSSKLLSQMTSVTKRQMFALSKEKFPDSDHRKNFYSHLNVDLGLKPRCERCLREPCRYSEMTGKFICDDPVHDNGGNPPKYPGARNDKRYARYTRRFARPCLFCGGRTPCIGCRDTGSITQDPIPRTRQTECTACNGSGRILTSSGEEDTDCPFCNGGGTRRIPDFRLGTAEDPEADSKAEPVSGSCIICLESPKNTAFLPCGHVCVCHICAAKMNRKCPACRSEGGYLRLYAM